MRMTLSFLTIVLFAYAPPVPGQGNATVTLHHAAPDTVDVMMTNNQCVAGIQFDVTGPTILGVTGGSATSAGWMLPFNPANGRVLGFSFPPLQTSIAATTTPTLLLRIIIDPTGPAVGVCPSPGCPPLLMGLTGIVISDVTANPMTTNASSSIYPPTITLGVTPGPGVTIPLQLSSPNDGGAPYVCGLTLSPSPGFTLPAPDSRVIPLSNDALLALSLTPGNANFLNYTGTLTPATGIGTATLVVPDIPSLAGFTIYSAFVTLSSLSSSGVGSISEAVSITL